MIQINKWDIYNKLTVIKEIERTRWPNWKPVRMVEVKCICWNSTKVQLSSLRTGHTKSCWCLIWWKIKHWMEWSRIYNIWRWLKSRCNNKSHRKIYNIITYDPKWEKFEWFYEDMKEWYSDKLTIDRIDNNWNYCKTNCRWATYKEQNRNTSNNRNLTYNWKTMCITDWAKELNITIDKINYHIKLKKTPISFNNFVINIS